MDEEVKVSKEAANAAYIVLWEFLSQANRRVSEIDSDLVLQFAEALGSANRIVIGE